MWEHCLAVSRLTLSYPYCPILCCLVSCCICSILVSLRLALRCLACVWWCLVLRWTDGGIFSCFDCPLSPPLALPDDPSHRARLRVSPRCLHTGSPGIRQAIKLRRKRGRVREKSGEEEDNRTAREIKTDNRTRHSEEEKSEIIRTRETETGRLRGRQIHTFRHGEKRLLRNTLQKEIIPRNRNPSDRWATDAKEEQQQETKGERDGGGGPHERHLRAEDN